uniref:Uncharacterized protein n=1 Tax=Poecilia mexicana TaxID=48701 RepID=A0A3B3YDV5_9TELE
DVLDYLNLTADNSVFRLTRPVRDHTHITVVKLDIIVYAILAVLNHLLVFCLAPLFNWFLLNLLQQWNNEFISWDPAQFCGITHISVPKDLLWTPDLFIYEMIEKDDSPRYLNVMVNFDGTIIAGDDIRVVTTCKMDVHKFPFDTQECSLSIGSSVYCGEMRILPSSNSSRVTQFSQQIMKTQGEWEFLHLSVTIKRRPLLHVINFLLPILFFLSLDLASFFISDHRGEKLGFKVTVLLAISVLLVILNDILPAMSNKTPLIGTNCSLTQIYVKLLKQTILIRFPAPLSDLLHCDFRSDAADLCQMVSDATRTILASDYLQVNSTLPSGESHVLLLILDELKKLQKTVYVHLGNREEKVKMVSWAKRINRSFFICYTITVFLFLYLIFREWKS